MAVGEGVLDGRLSRIGGARATGAQERARTTEGRGTFRVQLVHGHRELRAGGKRRLPVNAEPTVEGRLDP
jgi:hypothetical protein